jgi:hypothetical protein
MKPKKKIAIICSVLFCVFFLITIMSVLTGFLPYPVTVGCMVIAIIMAIPIKDESFE